MSLDRLKAVAARARENKFFFPTSGPDPRVKGRVQRPWPGAPEVAIVNEMVDALKALPEDDELRRLFLVDLEDFLVRQKNTGQQQSQMNNRVLDVKFLAQRTELQ